MNQEINKKLYSKTAIIEKENEEIQNREIHVWPYLNLSGSAYSAPSSISSHSPSGYPHTDVLCLQPSPPPPISSFFSSLSLFFFYSCLQQANHPLLHIPSAAPRAAHSKAVREAAKKIIIPRKPSSSGGGGSTNSLMCYIHRTSIMS